MPRTSRNASNPFNFSKLDIRKQSCSKWTFKIIVPNFVRRLESRDVPPACQGVPGQSSQSLRAAGRLFRFRSRPIQAHRNIQHINEILSEIYSTNLFYLNVCTNGGSSLAVDLWFIAVVYLVICGTTFQEPYCFWLLGTQGARKAGIAGTGSFNDAANQ